MILNLLILDTSVLIAICKEIGYPGFIDKLLELDSDLFIPSLLLECELIHTSIYDVIIKYIKEGKIKVIYLNTIDEINKLMKKYKLHLGEIDMILTYVKLAEKEIKACCVFDDKRARTKAKELEINFTGTVGLLKLLKAKKLLTLEEIKKIAKNLRKSNFRLSRYLIELGLI